LLAIVQPSYQSSKGNGLTHNKKVIKLPSSESSVWTFEDFVSSNNTNPIEVWRKEQSEEVQQNFDAVLKNIHKIANYRDWGEWMGHLRGKAKKYQIWEIGFKADRRQYRVFGIFGKKRRKQVILLLGCYHKMNVYTPRKAIDTAIKRAKALSEGRGKTNARPIDLYR
jgi:phage-related protein